MEQSNKRNGNAPPGEEEYIRIPLPKKIIMNCLR